MTGIYDVFGCLDQLATPRVVVLFDDASLRQGCRWPVDFRMDKTRKVCEILGYTDIP